MWPLLHLCISLLLLAASVDASSVRRPPPLRRFYSRDIAGANTTNTTTQAGIVSLAISDDKQSYFAVLAAGGIFFRVSLDTGSADLWITSSACTSSTCRSVPRYPLAYNSPTFASVNANGTAFAVSFVDSTAASGIVARESIAMANITVDNQVFGMVNSSNVTLGSETSGVLGLGFPRLSTIEASGKVANATPFFTSMAQQGLLDYPMFGMSLTLNNSGSLALGGIDASVVKNASWIVWNEVVPFAPFTAEDRNASGYLAWTLPLSTLLVNKTGIAPIPTYPNGTYDFSVALLDVGTSGVFGPWQDVARIFTAIPNARLVDDGGQWVVPCDIQETIGFTFGGFNFTMQPTDFLIGPSKSDPDLCLAWPQARSPTSDGIDWQLGTPFLRTVYSIFSHGIDDKEPPMIGLYPLANSTNVTLPTPASISSFLTSTINTVLPNSLLSTPTSQSTLSYAFNTSVAASAGEIVSSDLATSTYSALLVTPVPGAQINASALPFVTPSPVTQTLVLTDSNGHLFTSTSAAPSIALGQIPGALSASVRMAHVRWAVVLGAMACAMCAVLM